MLATRSFVLHEEVLASDEEDESLPVTEALSSDDEENAATIQVCSYTKSKGHPTASRSDISSCQGCRKKAGLIDYDICELSDGELRGPGYDYTLQGKTHAAFGCAIKKNCSWVPRTPSNLVEMEEHETQENTTTATAVCRWRSTANCSVYGYREPWRDLPCHLYIPHCFGTAGYCDCNGDNKKNFNDVGFNCSDITNITMPGDCCNSTRKCEDLCVTTTSTSSTTTTTTTVTSTSTVTTITSTTTITNTTTSTITTTTTNTTTSTTTTTTTNTTTTTSSTTTSTTTTTNTTTSTTTTLTTTTTSTTTSITTTTTTTTTITTTTTSTTTTTNTTTITTTTSSTTTSTTTTTSTSTSSTTTSTTATTTSTTTTTKTTTSTTTTTSTETTTETSTTTTTSTTTSTTKTVTSTTSTTTTTFTTTSTTTITLHCESKCMWRATNNCTPGGKLNPEADQWCGDEVCWGKSGFCDCNGNRVWEGNETGFTCGMNKKSQKKVLCNLECKIFNCTYQFFNTSNCTANGTGEIMYGKSRYKDFESDKYKSVLINHPGCQVTVFKDTYIKGESSIYSGTNMSGPVCKNFLPSFINKARSAESIDKCHTPLPR
eukprot:CAMPEP_0172818682 /NCGR_PEP_ID=MMETSP1075-20121228/14065_1 /TAXON_ID=2916 /ORGANISM="Ceratium fusus, Strain PA161109" /LENGTH=600 /DNA_ID=CAMNT_0013659071 /DNA_START=220 /DNA_END=2022 /DNA_ORIENTATION=+